MVGYMDPRILLICVPCAFVFFVFTREALIEKRFVIYMGTLYRAQKLKQKVWTYIFGNKMCSARLEKRKEK